MYDLDYDLDRDDYGDDPSYFDEDERDEDGNWPDDPFPARSDEYKERELDALLEASREGYDVPYLDDDRRDVDAERRSWVLGVPTSESDGG